MGELAKLPRIVGVKDATGDITRVSDQRAACGPDFIQLSGEDASALGFNAHGGVGCISVTANVAPAECAAFQAATLARRLCRGADWQDRLMPLHRALFLEPGSGGGEIRPVAAGPLFRGGPAATHANDRTDPRRDRVGDAPCRRAGLSLGFGL
jgi:dihydrodipicolinate synthase/N-acetylneuraminate lyase